MIAGGFVVNLSVDVSSVALISLCRELDAMYIDTCIEPWPALCRRRNSAGPAHQLRAARGSAQDPRDGPTAVVAHGANPAWSVTCSSARWCALRPTWATRWRLLPAKAGRALHAVGVKGIHIAERDTQWADVPKQADEFVNTWSIEGFLSEGLQPAELGWGHTKGTFRRRLASTRPDARRRST